MPAIELQRMLKENIAKYRKFRLQSGTKFHLPVVWIFYFNQVESSLL